MIGAPAFQVRSSSAASALIAASSATNAHTTTATMKAIIMGTKLSLLRPNTKRAMADPAATAIPTSTQMSRLAAVTVDLLCSPAPLYPTAPNRPGTTVATSPTLRASPRGLWRAR